MAQTKTIQLLRSQAVSDNLEAAKQVLLGVNGTGAKTAKDGEIVLVRYYANNDQTTIKSILGIYHKDQPLEDGSINGWTILEDVASSVEGLEHLQNEVNAIETSTGLKSDGTKDNFSGDDVLQVVEANDSLLSAISKIADRIGKMDKAASAVDGQVVTTVSEANGVVSETKANVKDLQLGGYSKDTSATGAIGSTDTVNTALSKLENNIAANDTARTVASSDQSITVTNSVSGTDVTVNVDGTTIVKDSSSHAIKSNLTVTQLTPTEVDALSDANVKEAYKLIYATDSKRAAIGDIVKIYKDSALQLVYLGTANDTINATTGVITEDSTITDKQSLNFKYLLANGTYSLTKVDVSKFLTQSEFGDGLSVNTSTGVVSVNAGNGLEINSTSKAVEVNIDSTSEEVITAYGTSNTTSAVLSVGTDGVKVSNIQAAIDAKVGTLDVTDSAVSGQYVSAVNETDGKVSMTRANVADAVLTGYSKGSAPASGSEAVAATDDVKGAIAKLEHQVDAAVSAASTAVSGLDGTADAANAESGYTPTVPTADFQVLTKVVETDGVVQAVGASNGSTSATLKKLAATGAAEDVSIVDSNSLIIATNVEGALQEIATNVNNNHIVNNDVITVVTDTENHNTKLTVTTGNGLEKTGTDGNTLAVKQGDGVTVDANGVSVKAGDGLVIDNSGNVNVNTGDGLEIASDAVKIKLDTATTTANITSDMLSISANGLMMKDTWDCGVF